MNFDINSMMQQASKMKEDLQRKQEEFSKNPVHKFITNK